MNSKNANFLPPPENSQFFFFHYDKMVFESFQSMFLRPPAARFRGPHSVSGFAKTVFPGIPVVIQEGPGTYFVEFPQPVS